MEVSVEPLSEKIGGAADRGTDTSGRVCGDRFLPPERRYRMGPSAAMKLHLDRAFMKWKHRAKAEKSGEI